MNSKQRFLGACRGAALDRPPVWIMRQAGRTLPEYNAVRQRHSFMDIVRTPELAALVTLQPVQRFPLDAAIIFSDILVVPAAMGVDVQFVPHPVLGTAVKSSADVDALRVGGAAESLGYVAEALRIVRAELGDEKALLGFAGAPFTIASYMVEGGGSKTYSKVKGLMYREPALYDRLLTAISDVTADYLAAQIAAGADAVQIFDSWAGELGPADFAQFALPYVQRIAGRLAGLGAPVIYYVNGVGNLLEHAKASGAGVLGIDWRVELGEVRRRLGSATVVQGNLDPAVLFGPKELIRAKTYEIISQTTGVSHILNLGHGVQPDTPLEGIETFVQAVVDWRRPEHE
jgi:uroporphyrinogen decarboxylase